MYVCVHMRVCVHMMRMYMHVLYVYMCAQCCYVLSYPHGVGDHRNGVSLGRIQPEDVLQQSYRG